MVVYGNIFIKSQGKNILYNITLKYQIRKI